MGIFEIIGPSMIGPSSSHTAGACRIGWAARQLLGESPLEAHVELHGSFLATGDGHGTKEAIVAGLLGMEPDDPSLIESLKKAAASDLKIDFKSIDLGPQAHPNSVRIFLKGSTQTLTLRASSVGGGNILLEEIDAIAVSISGTLESLVLWHKDTSGFLARITAVLACVQINVATIRTSRVQRGEKAITIIEIDGHLPEHVASFLKEISLIDRFVVLPPLPGL